MRKIYINIGNCTLFWVLFFQFGRWGHSGCCFVDFTLFICLDFWPHVVTSSYIMSWYRQQKEWNLGDFISNPSQIQYYWWRSLKGIFSTNLWIMSNDLAGWSCGNMWPPSRTTTWNWNPNFFKYVHCKYKLILIIKCITNHFCWSCTTLAV